MSPYFRLTIAALIVIAGSMLAFIASAAIVSESDAPWQLADGSKVYSNHATEAVCWEAYAVKKAELASRTSGQLYLGCQKKNLLKFGRIVQPPPVNCVVSEYGEWSACESGTQTRTRTIVTQPANGGAACPVLSESQACEVPQPGPWAHCANEGGRCGFTGLRTVRYGAGSQWSEAREFLDGVNCTNGVFGDPAPGVVKACQISTSETEPEPGTRSQLLTWEIVDQSVLDGLVGFSIYFSQDLGTISSGGTFLQVPDARAYRVEGLTPGRWYFAVAGVSDSQSMKLSNIVQKDVQ